MQEVLDLESSGNIYNPEPDREDVERLGYELAKSFQIRKLSRRGVDRLLRRDYEAGKGPYLLVEYSYLVKLFKDCLQDIDTNM